MNNLMASPSLTGARSPHRVSWCVTYTGSPSPHRASSSTGEMRCLYWVGTRVALLYSRARATA